MSVSNMHEAMGSRAEGFAYPTGRSAWVMYSSVLGFSPYLLINFLLVPKIDVLGVSIDALLGSAVSLTVVLAGVHRQIGLSLLEIVITAARWFSWVTICIGLLLGGESIITSGVVLLGLTARLQWVVLDNSNTTMRTAERVVCSS